MQVASVAQASPQDTLRRTDRTRSATDQSDSRSRDTQKIRNSLAAADTLTSEERKRVAELKKIDREVRVHEQAHVNRAGAYATAAPSYRYVTGPDGKQYAVAGEVKIDTSPEADPKATLRKAEAIQAAAVAPAEPSSQDRIIAAKAAQMAREAQQELKKEEKDQENRDVDPRLDAYRPPPPEDAGRLLSLLA